MSIVNTNKDPGPILVLMQDSPLRKRISKYLKKLGYDYIATGDIVKALQIIPDKLISIVMLDVEIEGNRGKDALQFIIGKHRTVEVVVVSEKESIEQAVEIMQQGAFDYFGESIKLDDLKETLEEIQKVLYNRGLAGIEDNDYPNKTFGMIGRSPGMQKIYSFINKSACVRETVLITGESGTGKELVANAIHDSSDNRKKPFIPVNCSAIPGELMESELFGHIEGSYTGAKKTQEGYFQAADGGTIFLDEIGNMNLTMQSKFLRVLENNEVWKVGARNPDIIDVRIIPATNKNLDKLVKQNKFREDLLYRLKILSVNMVPLRKREEDILRLVNYFTKKFIRELNMKRITYSDEVLDHFQKYYWPGNVRELENIIKQLVVMSEGKRIMISDLPPYMRDKLNLFNEKRIERDLKEVEKEHISLVMDYTKGNKTHAAEILGITRTTLRSKLKKYKLE